MNEDNYAVIEFDGKRQYSGRRKLDKERSYFEIPDMVAYAILAKEMSTFQWGCAPRR